MTIHSNKSTNSKLSVPADVCLLLRAHAEARWLSHEVLPFLRELEHRRPRSSEQTSAALCYLEALWIEACGRAAETDAVRVELDDRGPIDQALYDKAHRYHAAVRRQRNTIAVRVQLQLATATGDSACAPESSRVSDDGAVKDRPPGS